MMKNIIKKIEFRVNNIIEKELPKVAYKSRFLSNLYYLLFNNSFSREHQATLAGKVKHIKEAEKLKANYFMLVRNTHRIEKGLLMRPRKDVFAKNYIAETIDSLKGVWKQHDSKVNPQMKWFNDVLDEYFTVAGKDDYVQTQKQKFLKITGITSANGTVVKKSVPYFRDHQNVSTISYDEFYKLTRQRRSVRWYLQKPVDRTLIDKAILAANQSPSACNRQPFEFRIIDDPSLVKQVAEFPMGTQGYSHSIPVLIVIVGNLDAYFDERDRHVIYIDASLANMSLMLALETLGLSSCPINWPDIEAREQKMENFLKLKKHQRPVMCLSVGYPDPEGMVAYSEKRPLEQIRKYNL